MVNQPWMEYDFTDGTGTALLDFEDEIPTNVIPLNTTVRIIGDVVENNGRRKIDVDGLQTLGASPARANATAAQVNAGGLVDQEVSLKGQIKDLVYDAWNLWEFQDGTGKTEVDLENKLTRAQVPQHRTMVVYGQVDEDFGEYKVDSRLMLVAGSYGN